MNHDEIRHKLSEYIDGSITAEEKTAIDEHLKTCGACSNALGELQKTIEHIKTIEEAEPPVWMTQKIMAKVRSEGAEQKSWFRRLFFPLSVKIPIQAVAVLFLAVGAFYIYRSIQPSYGPAEAPVKVLEAGKETTPIPAESREEKIARRQLPPAERVPQSPEYKSLDMKQEYEKTAPPTLADKMAPAPAPASPAEQPTMAAKEAERFALQASAPAMAGNQAGGSGILAGATQQSETKREGTPAQKTQAAKALAQNTACLSYEPSVVTVSGVIRKIDFPGPPQYESIAKGDTRETYLVLKLSQAVCTLADKNDIGNEAESNVTEIQLVLDPAKYDKYRKLLSLPVNVRGTLFHAITGHHHTPVLLNVSEITAK